VNNIAFGMLDNIGESKEGRRDCKNLVKNLGKIAGSVSLGKIGVFFSDSW